MQDFPQKCSEKLSSSKSVLSYCYLNAFFLFLIRKHINWWRCWWFWFRVYCFTPCLKGCFFFCLPSNLLYFASMFPGCRQPQKTDALLLYSCGNRDNPGRSRLTVPARTSPSIYLHSGFHINLKFPQQHTYKIFCWFHPNAERFNSTSAPSYPYVTPRGGGAKVPASNPGVYTMGAWRRLPQAKPSAAERVESLCQLLWNAEADWWGPGDSFRAWWGSRQRCEPEQTPQGTPSPSVHTFGAHVTELPDAPTWEKWKKRKVFWGADVMF